MYSRKIILFWNFNTTSGDDYWKAHYPIQKYRCVFVPNKKTHFKFFLKKNNPTLFKNKRQKFFYYRISEIEFFFSKFFHKKVKKKNWIFLEKRERFFHWERTPNYFNGEIWLIWKVIMRLKVNIKFYNLQNKITTSDLFPCTNIEILPLASDLKIVPSMSGVRKTWLNFFSTESYKRDINLRFFLVVGFA